MTPPGKPGRFAIHRGFLQAAQAAALYLVVLGLTGALIAAGLLGWQKDVRGLTAIWALFALILVLAREIDNRTSSALEWLKGGEFEESVGLALDGLSAGGWTVIHRLPKDWGGDVDHVVCGPHGVYAIETKSGTFSGKAAGQAEGNARFVRYRLKIPWVVPVVCVGDPEQRCQKKGNVWVMHRDELVAWLEGRRDRPVDAIVAGRLLPSA